MKDQIVAIPADRNVVSLLNRELRRLHELLISSWSDIEREWARTEISKINNSLVRTGGTVVLPMGIGVEAND